MEAKTRDQVIDLIKKNVSAKQIEQVTGLSIGQIKAIDLEQLTKTQCNKNIISAKRSVSFTKARKRKGKSAELSQRLEPSKYKKEMKLDTKP